MEDTWIWKVSYQVRSQMVVVVWTDDGSGVSLDLEGKGVSQSGTIMVSEVNSVSLPCPAEQLRMSVYMWMWYMWEIMYSWECGSLCVYLYSVWVYECGYVYFCEECMSVYKNMSMNDVFECMSVWVCISICVCQRLVWGHGSVNILCRWQCLPLSSPSWNFQWKSTIILFLKCSFFWDRVWLCSSGWLKKIDNLLPQRPCPPVLWLQLSSCRHTLSWLALFLSYILMVQLNEPLVIGNCRKLKWYLLQLPQIATAYNITA